MRKFPRKSHNIFLIFLIPLSFIILVQAVSSYGSVIFSNTFSALKTYSIDRLHQVTQTRKAIFESSMKMQWTVVAQEYDIANRHLNEVLTSANIPLSEFLKNDALQQEYLTRLLPTWYRMMRRNSTTGAFVILASPNVEESGGALNTVYIRDTDPTVNSADLSDVQLVYGPTTAINQLQISFAANWRSKLALRPAGRRSVDDFFYAPYKQALKSSKAKATDLSYWNPLFSLESESADSYSMITYTLPLITPEGKVYGVMGIELSENYLSQLIPYREVNTNRTGGYLLLRRDTASSYVPLFVNGPAEKRAVDGMSTLTLKATGFDAFYELLDTKSSDRLYTSLTPLDMYQPNTPFANREWYLAGVENHDTLFRVGMILSRNFSMVTALSLLLGIAAVYLIVSYVTRPIRRLSICIQNSALGGLSSFSPSYITEVDELYETIRNLTDWQQESEYALMQEKERYRAALQSSTDILVSYDLSTDCATLYNLNGQTQDIMIQHLMHEIEIERHVHPDDLPYLQQALKNPENEIKLSLRVNWGDEYQWCDLSGRFLLGADGVSPTLIGSMRNVHEQKLQELKLLQAVRIDQLTGLYCYAAGEAEIRGQFLAGGCLAVLDIHKLLEINDQFGMVVGDTVLERIGAMLLQWAQQHASKSVVAARMGGDEFILWLGGFDKQSAYGDMLDLLKQSTRLYQGDHVNVYLSAGATMVDGQSFQTALKEAKLALTYHKLHPANFGFYQDLSKSATQPSLFPAAIDTIEHTAAVSSNIVSLTFNFFDKSRDLPGILTFLFPKLGHYFQATEIILSQARRDFFTTQIYYQWHFAGVPADAQPIHFSPDEFSALEQGLLEDQPSICNVADLTPAQRRFFRIPTEQEAGTLFLLYDNGIYMSCIAFLHQSEGLSSQYPLKSDLHEVVKIIDSNIKRARYDLANRAKSDFLSRMSHEIRTPMNAIMGMTTIAKTHTNDSHALAIDLEKIDQSSRYLLGLINDILDMSKIESGKMTLENTDFDLKSLANGLEDLISVQAAEKGIHYQSSISLRTPCVQGDPLHLNQVLLNLLSNAMKFTPSGERVTLSVTQQPETNEYLFSVSDTGIGIKPENVSRIFQSFEQEDVSTARSFGGTGLGLAISLRLVRMMGSDIVLESTPGIGSTFSFTLHLAPGHQQQQTEASGAENIRFDGKRVLVAEDNELNIEIVQTFLEMYGFAVDVARDGQEAVKRFQMHPSGRYDLILMDIHMPIMDGLEATKIIRQCAHADARRIPIIAMTANAFDEDTKKSVESGMNAHLAKPIDIALFVQTISAVLQKD